MRSLGEPYPSDETILALRAQLASASQPGSPDPHAAPSTPQPQPPQLSPQQPETPQLSPPQPETPQLSPQQPQISPQQPETPQLLPQQPETLQHSPPPTLALPLAPTVPTRLPICEANSHVGLCNGKNTQQYWV